MNNDMSWLGLYRKGYKLEVRKIGTNYGWINLEGWLITDELFKNSLHQFRYKHSIQ